MLPNTVDHQWLVDCFYIKVIQCDIAATAEPTRVKGVANGLTMPGSSLVGIPGSFAVI